MPTEFNIPSGFPVAELEKFAECTIDGSIAKFDCCEDRALKLIGDATEGKKWISVTPKAFEPTESDLQKLGFTRESAKEKGLRFVKLETANTLLDKDGDILEESFLNALAAKVNEPNGRAILLHHDRTKIVGRKFRAEVVDRIFPNNQSGKQLVEFGFVHNSADDGGVSLGEKLDSRTIADVSIGFFGSGRKFEDKDNGRIRRFFHTPGETTTENMETSFVFLGAQEFSFVGKYATKDFTKVSDAKTDITAWVTVIKGRSLAAALNRGIAAWMESNDGSRADAIAGMGRAAGIGPDTVNSILSGSINCPPEQRLRGFSRFLGISMSSLQTAANADGCNEAEENQYDPKISKAMDAIKVKITIDGEDKTVTGTDAIQSAFEEQNAVIANLRDEIESLKTPFVNTVLQREKDLQVSEGIRRTEDELKAMELKRLQALADDLETKYKKANPNPEDGKEVDGGGKGSETKEPKYELDY